MIRFPSFLSTISSLLLLTTPALQVSITLSLFPLNDGPRALTATCNNISPGLCCRFPGTGSDAGAVTFSHLTTFDIAAIWKFSADPMISPTGKGGGCSGRILRSRGGPGDWRWTSESGLIGDRVTGGSYVTLPRTLPPGEEEKKWMAVEGLLAMAWGGGEWSASLAARRLFGSNGVTPKSRARRDIRSSEKGRVFARSPTHDILPDRIESNETAFVLYNAVDMTYKDDEGGLVNLTTLFIVDSD
ncbi:MAG: hypothetical protein Q9188_001865 [Gyalolechia gomerana]